MKYTVGELAKKLGVSARTVRFYDEKGLMVPCGYSESGYRLYDEGSAAQLQKIIMLKYMDFSLEQIADMMKDEDTDLQKSLKNQEKLLIDKKEHITRLIDALKKTEESCDEEFWENMRNVIEMTKNREEVITQFKNDDNLNKRISIHDYSTAETEWFHWLLEREELSEGMKILDIGCGNGMFWKRLAKQLPDNLEVHLVDYSDGMLESVRENVDMILEEYPEKKLRFVIEKRDATDFSYPTSGFDRIMANHMLYFLKRENRLQLYKNVEKLLAANGRFTCTLIGRHHMKELHDFVNEFYPDIKYPSANFDIFLETAREEIQEYFRVLAVEEHENNLYVPREEVVFDYVASYSEESEKMINRDKELFFERVRSKMNEEGYMCIHKSTGVVICEVR